MRQGSVTLNTYKHLKLDDAKEEMEKLALKAADAEEEMENRDKSGAKIDDKSVIRLPRQKVHRGL